MQIETSKLLQYTISRQSSGKPEDNNSVKVDKDDIKITSNISYIQNDVNIDKSNVGVVSNINYVDTATLGGKEVDISGVLSDDEIEKIISQNTPPTTVKTFSTTYKELSEERIRQIKQVIYDLHHKTTPSPVDPDEPKTSFITEFSDTDTMFEYLHTIDSSISKETGITRAQLVKLTQNDNWEDANYDFFGSLNRIFNALDKDNNSKLSASEIETFIQNELGDISSYKSKVNQYAQEIQNTYSSLSNQQKLEFVLDRTREYLEAQGLTKQLAALDRLTKQTDTHNSIKVGNIAIADLNPDKSSSTTTLGAYTYLAATDKYTNPNTGYSQNIIYWGTDNDDTTNDLGITLDKSLLDKNWYELVDTMVHELTHATASQWYTEDDDYGNIASFYPKNIDDIYNAGGMTEDEYNYIINNWSNICNGSIDYIDRLYYLAASMWGEYMAYQTDADYLDSIGADVYDKGNGLTTAVYGKDEKSTIEKHIEDLYNIDNYREVLPEFEWWTYG